MKIKNLLLTVVLSFIWVGSSFSQAFQQTYFELGVDFNHFSIEKHDVMGGYICAGTIFDSGNNDICVFSTDNFGNIIWKKIIDLTSDDRALDLAIDPVTDEIIITGYTSPSGSGDANLYIAILDIGGNIIADKSLTTVSGTNNSVGTNVIASASGKNYIVGGFFTTGSSLGYPLSGNEAILVEFDASLNVVNKLKLTNGGLGEHTSINDIVEINGGGYFVTGSVNIGSGGSQGVLAVLVDYSLAVVNSASFEDTNSEHVGVSLVYDDGNDILYLMSNNSIIHNPQITEYVDVVGGGLTLINNYSIELDPAPFNSGLNAAGFQLKQSLSNPGALVACGYFKEFPSLSNNTTPWVVEFIKGTGTNISAYIWPTTANNFDAHGGGVLSTFQGEHPYIFNQEILTERLDGQGFVFIGPREVGGSFGIDLVTTSMFGAMPCYIPIGQNTSGRGDTFVSATGSSLTVSSSALYASSVNATFYGEFFCGAMFGSSMPTDTDNTTAETESDITTALGNSENTMELESFKVSPNPFNSNFTILLTGENLTGSLTITNTMGQIVHQSEQMSGNTFTTEINAENFENGIYIISYLNAEGVLKTKKVVKL